MSSGKGPAGFPDVEAKLQKPTKQSAFERQKAEAEAKRQREAAETAAVYADFVKSFDRDDDDDTPDTGAQRSFGPPRPRQGFSGGPPLGHGASKRHFVSSGGLKSGPGSLGPPPSSFGKKRTFNDFSKASGSKEKIGVLGGFDEPSAGPAKSLATAFNASDDEDEVMGDSRDRAEEKAIAKPTLRLTNLPLGTSPAVVKALIPENMTVENVRILPPSAPGGSERKCSVAIVTLSKETPANEMDAAVSALQNRYLGYGYYLSLHRHLSSAVAASSAMQGTSLSLGGGQPFGAKPVEQPSGPDKPAHQHGFHRGFAPPSSYGPAGMGINRSNLLYVPVQPPQDVRTIQLISKTIEGVLEHGPQFEALLMSRPDVQREERWAWIWDARSEGGIWYRWRLWEVVTGSDPGTSKGKYLPLFEGGHAWKSPEKGLTFEYTTALDEFVSDPEYNSSDDEEMDGDGNGENNNAEVEKPFLNPLDKAKLAHLLARLPSTLSKLRKGDIARVTTFAITHASRGADEVVDMIVSNVEKPLSLTAANPDRKQDSKEGNQPTGTEDGGANEAADTSGASLVGLYVVSDVLSSSGTSGVRHAWRFRLLFETSLQERRVFERLGMMADKLGWGRLRAEKWKRSINLVLNLWEGWCVFPAESQEFFVRTFESPPSLKVEDTADDASKRGKWKVVEALPATTKEENPPANNVAPTQDDSTAQEDVDGEPLEDDDVMGEPIDDEDVEGEPIDEEDVAGEPMDEAEINGDPMDEDADASLNDSAASNARPDDEYGGGTAGDASGEHAGRTQQRKRMRAVDMFADSDGSDNGS